MAQLEAAGGERRKVTFKAAAATMETTQRPDRETDCGKVQLERKIGLTSAVALIVGSMIGSGIFISPKGVLEGTGSIGLSLIIWAACGLLSMLGSLCYIELGTLISESGGEFAYYMAAFGQLHKFWGPVPAFLYSWVSAVMLGPSSAAIITLTFARYAAVPFYDACGPPSEVTKCLAVVAIIALACINCFSVKLATRVQNFFTAAKLFACVIIIIGGFVNLARGHTKHLSNAFEGTKSNPAIVSIAFYNGLWAYSGWSSLNFVTEEVKNPNRNLPLACVIALPLVAAVYLLMNISYFTVMSPAELLASPAVGMTWGSQMLGVVAWIIPLSVAFSTFGAANATLFTQGRLCYVAAREGHLFQVLSMVQVKMKTPTPGLLFTAVGAVIMIIPSNIGGLIDFFSFAAWMFYGLAMVALLVMRRTKKDAPRPYRVPTAIPVIVLIASVYLVVAPVVNSPHIGFLIAFLIILLGLVFYVPFVHYGMQLEFIDHVTVFLQKLMEIVPTDKDEEEEEEKEGAHHNQ